MTHLINHKYKYGFRFKRLIKTLIDKYADPKLMKENFSYFSDYEVFKSIKATHNFYKGEGGQVAKDGKKLFDCIKDYFDGVERILSRHQKRSSRSIDRLFKKKKYK